MRVLNLSLPLFLLLTTICVFSALSSVNAQDSKPKLVEIVLDEETNDPEALEIAKKLDPKFFEIDLDYTNNFNDAKYFAKFTRFGSKDYLLLTVRDTYFHCTKYGCPFILFENVKNNSWKFISKFVSYTLIYDANSNNPDRPNIIGRTFDPVNTSKNEIFLWNGATYRKVER